MASTLSFPGVFRPSLDSFAKNPLFSAYPAKLLEQGKVIDVPLMIGYTKDEGILSTGGLLAYEEKKDLLL